MMNKFLKFLRCSKQNLENPSQYEKILIVLGNESCDLDSTVCTLALSFFKHLQKTPNELVVPILNCNSKYFNFRTETCYLLNQQHIEADLLIYKDEVDFKNLLKVRKLETSLVDHHVLADEDKFLAPTVGNIFDHRPLNKKEIAPHDEIVIEMVGSCSTLISQLYINQQPDLLRVYRGITDLLYAAIIYDTIGLDKTAGRMTETDLNVAEYLENIIKPIKSRKDFFQELWRVHNDINMFTSKELLYRDLKVTNKIPVAGLPLLVEDYLRKDDALEGISEFAAEYNTDLVVLIGINAGNGVKRDIGVYFMNEESKNLLVNFLKSDQLLELTELPANQPNVLCFRQNNITLTRKYILPLINNVSQHFANCSD